MYISLDSGKSVTKITANGLEFSTDNGETWQSFGYRPEDAADVMFYFATQIVDADGHIHEIDREKPIKKAFNNLEGETCCQYCRYQDECHGITSNGRGEPIYPACANALEPSDYMDYEKFKEDYLGEFKEENFMKILDIYRERKYKELKDLFKQKEKDMLDNNKYIKEYNEIVNEFSAKLEEFATRTDVKAEEMLLQTGYKTGPCAYEIKPSYMDNLTKDLITEYNQEEAKLEKYIDEVKAIIELIPAGESYDGKVIEVLKNYEILDKKGKINA